MRLSKRAFVPDEERGKKDDDHRPSSGRGKPPSFPAWKVPRRRRLLLAIVGFYLLYLFFKNMPTDLQPAMERYDPRIGQLRQKAGPLRSPIDQSFAAPPDGAPPKDKDAASEAEKHYYNGRIKFYSLAKSLYRASWAPADRHDLGAKRAVLFAGANLKSVADLVPLACEMSRQKANDVHFAIMGRDDVSIGGIQQVNGISNDDCPIHWHDGRPDYAPWSTDSRMERAVRSSLGYIGSQLHPQVLITHGESREDSFFWKGIKRKAEAARLPHIVLSSKAGDLMWLSKLDSSSLRAWNELNIEMLVHAPSESSGSLIRLIKSLETADYLGSVPSLTIDLPPHIDSQLLRFLENMNWPPGSSGKVTLRRRIQPRDMTSEESAIRAVENFYPRNPNTSHVLMLSPQTVLSPSFFHYLKYTVLKYKFSTDSANTSSRLLGISLELPSSKPTDSEPFTPPTVPPSDHTDQQNGDDGLPLFLWQVPNSNAALYFGDKWIEFHSFLSNRLAAQKISQEISPQKKLISKKYPAFMEYLLELIRSRGYYMLYPSFPARFDLSLATVHNELYHPPEELASERTEPLEPDAIILGDSSEPLEADSDIEFGSIERPLSHASTVTALLRQFPGHLPDLDSLHTLSYKGEEISSQAATQEAEEYAKDFKTRFGGCRGSSTSGEMSLWKADDLFCLDN
ncbi:hypothetical protein VTN02DRAFT_3624 [Thermoascus thermophilus]